MSIRTVKNKHNLTSIYLKDDRAKEIWQKARKKALESGMTLTQYILSLIEKDLKDVHNRL